MLNKKREYWISNPVNKLKFKFGFGSITSLIIVHPVSCLICMYSVISMHLSYIYYLVFTIQYCDMSASGVDKCFVFCPPCVITQNKLPSLVFMYLVWSVCIWYLVFIFLFHVFIIIQSDLSASGVEKCFVFCLPCVITRKKRPLLPTAWHKPFCWYLGEIEL